MTENKKRRGAPFGSANAQKGDEPATARINIRVTPSLKRAIEDRAEEKLMSQSSFIVDAILNQLY